MPRWARGWPEALKARAARYALQRWLGPFLEEPLRLEQLGLDLRGGTGTLRELRLRAAVSGDAGGTPGVAGAAGSVLGGIAGFGGALENPRGLLGRSGAVWGRILGWCRGRSGGGFGLISGWFRPGSGPRPP